MKRIFAPWRMSFILEYDKSKCIFCDLPKDKDNDRKNLILYRSKNTFVIMNKFPYTNGHVMVSAYGHKAKLTELDPAVLHEIMDTASLAMKAIEKSMSPEGFNIGVNQGKVAGAGYDGHLHFHIVPRWRGDTNFMPVLGETKVLAEHLEATYDKISKYF